MDAAGGFQSRSAPPCVLTSLTFCGYVVVLPLELVSVENEVELPKWRGRGFRMDGMRLAHGAFHFFPRTPAPWLELACRLQFWGVARVCFEINSDPPSTL